MLENLPVINFLIFATCFGFVAAIIFTNIQRTAISKFITNLVSNKITDESTAIDCRSIGLNSVERTIIKSAVKNQNGLKNVICTVDSGSNSNDRLEQALVGAGDNIRYYLFDCDTELLLKRYSYNTMKTKHVVLFIAALIAVVIATTFAVDWMIEKVSLPELENNDKDTETSDTNSPTQDEGNETNNVEDSTGNEDSNNDETTNTEDTENKKDQENDSEADAVKPTGPIVPYS